LIKNSDGTLTICLQSTIPGKDMEANWLPTPKAGRWYGNLRAYAPRPREPQARSRRQQAHRLQPAPYLYLHAPDQRR
jgi:hypothetical protein